MTTSRDNRSSYKQSHSCDIVNMEFVIEVLAQIAISEISSIECLIYKTEYENFIADCMTLPMVVNRRVLSGFSIRRFLHCPGGFFSF